MFDSSSITFRRTVDRVAVGITTIWIVTDVLAGNVLGKVRFPDSIVDYALMYRYSRAIIHSHAYGSGLYPYPPPSVILQYATAIFPWPLSAALWMVLTAIAALGCWWILVKMLGLEKAPGNLALLPPAYAFSSYFFHWDLSKQNINVIFLAVTLLGVHYVYRSRPVLGGFYIALGFSIKLFSILVIPYLLWTRRFRAFLWSMAFLLILWVVMPAAVFGVKDMLAVYQGWFNQLHLAAEYSVSHAHPILISLARSASQLFPADLRQAASLVDVFWLLWLLLVLILLAAARRRTDSTDAFELLSDVSILILAPIAVSPYLEPYHPVAAAIPGLLLLVTAADATQARRVRLLAVGAFAVAFLIFAVPSPFAIRGLLVNLKLLIATGGTQAVILFGRKPRSGYLQP